MELGFWILLKRLEGFLILELNFRFQILSLRTANIFPVVASLLPTKAKIPDALTGYHIPGLRITFHGRCMTWGALSDYEVLMFDRESLQAVFKFICPQNWKPLVMT